jgi:hypothetical protein
MRLDPHHYGPPKVREARRALIAAFTPEGIVRDLDMSGGTLEVMPNGIIKLTGTGLLPAVWHEAFTLNQKAVIALARTPERTKP